MLIVSRKDADPNMTLADLFRDGPIEITVYSQGSKRVKMGVPAPEQLRIWRKAAVTA